jgi:uncharacterized protein
MRIFVDGDANPNAIKEIIYRAVERIKIQLIIVANQPSKIPDSKYISSLVVKAGPDEADDRIVELVLKNDLVITSDVPLADRVISKEGFVLDPRGTLYTSENIKERLAVRDLMSELRNSGLETGGPSAYSPRDRQAFANQLDKFLTKYVKSL